jgi:DNA-binding transcriptional ArsR family regulator
MARKTSFQGTESDGSSSGDRWDAAANTEITAIRALAHPLRLRILDLIRDRGAMTATEVSEIVGESPTNCAFHLRTLGRYGFLEEAGGGAGRARPWRPRSRDMTLDETAMDAATAAAAAGFRTARRAQARIRRAEWEARAAGAPIEWRRAAF